MTTKIEKLQDKLINACSSADAKEAERILRNNPSLVNVTTLDVSGWTSILHDAAENGDIEVCKVLVSCGADINRPAAALGYVTPLVQAAEEGHLQVVQFLIDKGAYVDGVDETSASPLICAVDSGHYEVAKCLLAHGADVNRMDHNRRYYAVDFADRKKDGKILTMLRRAGGFGTQSKVDFESRLGYPVICLVSNYAGPVYPVPFSRSVGLDEVVLHMAAIEESRGKLLMLFTSGVYLHGQPVDMNVVLPMNWPILQKYLVQPSALSFPFDFLSRMAEVARSTTQVSHGMVVKSSDPVVKGLVWPRDISGMVAVDYAWPRRRGVSVQDNASTEGEVDILTFVPIVDDFKSEKSKVAWYEKKKNATWKSLSFPGWKTLN